METKYIFHREDDVNLVSEAQGAEYVFRARVTSEKPLLVEIRSSLGEKDMAKIKATSQIIVANARSGYAYKAKFCGMDPNGLVELSLIERYENRTFFRVDTVVQMGYEVIRRVALPPDQKADDLKSFKDIEGIDAAAPGIKSMAKVVFNMYDEMRKLRQQFEKSSHGDTTVVSSRAMSISGAGIRFNTNVQHEKGDVLKIHLILPGVSRPLRIVARVVRVEWDAAGGAGGNQSVACNFDEVSDADREAVIRFVVQSQRQMLTRRAAKKV